MAEGRTRSGRHVLCLGFLLFLISATALAISIVALVKAMNNDKDIRTKEKSVVEKQQITSTTAGHRGQSVISTSDYSRQHVISTTSSRQHESSSDDDRTDSLVGCHNRGIENKATCEKMGCIWRETAPGKNQPSCVFGDEAGYSVNGKIQRNENQYTATLRKKSLRRIYGMEIFDNVQMVVDTYHDSALRIYIKGGPSPFEIPDEALHMNRPTGSRNLQYNVSFVTDPYFGIIVTRISTGAVIFNTTLPGLILSEQFVQISTKLPSDNLYGFGEHNHRRYKHDMNWRTWPIFTRDVAPVDDWNLYGAYPVYMNLENDGKANMAFLRNSHAMDVVLQPDPYPAITYKVIGGVLDFYVFLGPSPQEAIQQFTYAVGRPMMQPYWSLGFHLSRWGYQNLTHMETVVDRTRAAGIPQDVQWGDIDYMYKKFVFTRNRQTFQDLPQFVGKLHQRGQKFVIIVDPGVGSNKTLYKEAQRDSPGYRVYDDGLERDVFVKTANGSVLEGEVWPGLTVYPDFTHPNVTDWLVKWINFFQSNESVQVDGLWVDMNEPSNFKPGSTTGCSRNKWNHPPYVPHILEGDKDNGSLYYKTLCMDAQQYWGKEYSVHSLYGHSNCIAAHKALTQILPGKRPFIMTRSSFVGTSKYAAHWSGDNQSQWRQLPWSIVWMLEFSMFGFSMLGADICGFYFETNYELCLRWMQVGAFYPFSRNHNAMGFRDQDPANWDEAFSYIAKDIIRTRYRILPYMYTLLYDAHISGKTVTGALMWEFPHDKNTWSVDRQFLLGPALLITPVLEEGKRSVEGYFPDARWFSYYDGKEIKHPGNNVTFDTPLNQINLHLRGGYILPVQEPDMTTAERYHLGLTSTQKLSAYADGIMGAWHVFLVCDEGYWTACLQRTDADFYSARTLKYHTAARHSTPPSYTDTGPTRQRKFSLHSVLHKTKRDYNKQEYYEKKREIKREWFKRREYRESRKRDLGLLVSFDRSYTATGYLFWDDGESSDSIESGNFLMLHFNASSGNSLNINVIHNKYPGAATLKIGTVEVYGLSTFPTKVTVDHNATDDSQIRYKSKILQIVGLSMSIVHNHTLSWE